MNKNKILSNKKLMAAVICGVIATTAATTTYAMESVSEGWHGEGTNRYFINEDGARVSGWLHDEEFGSYYFNDLKELQVGWAEIDGVKYHFDEETGKLSTGITKVNDEEYFFQKDGKILTGWQESNTRYYNEFGFSLTGQQTVDGQNYNFDADGKLHKGWFNSANGTYYYDEEGTMSVGWKNMNDTSYYFHEDGRMAMGEEVNVDGEVRYFDKDGTVRTGWYTNAEGNRYYYNEFGNKQFGLQKIDGEVYFFNEFGAMLRNDKAEGYTFDGNGVGSKVEAVTGNVTNQTPEANNDQAPVYTNAGNSSVGSSVASAALAQLGVYQDCTMLVTNALASVGIYHHGWPVSYLSLGTIVSAAEAQPGDLIYYADNGYGVAHVAVYIGGGQAVHGGFYGTQTVIWSADLGGSAPVYVRLP